MPHDADLIFNSAGEPKEIAMIEECDHRFSEHYRIARELTFKWLEKHFGKMLSGSDMAGT